METLRQKQSQFAIKVAEWIEQVYSMGYEITFGENYRSDEQAAINALGSSGRAQLTQILRPHPGMVPLATAISNNTGSGIKNSLHTIRLALDFNLFKDGRYSQDIEEYKEVGEAWEQMGEDHRWGGRFKDYGHISIEHNGVK